MPADELHTSAVRARANVVAAAGVLDVLDVVGAVAAQATTPQSGTRVRVRVHRYASAGVHMRSSALVAQKVVCLRVLAQMRRSGASRACRRRACRGCLWAVSWIPVALTAGVVAVAVGVPLVDGRSCSCLRWIA